MTEADKWENVINNDIDQENGWSEQDAQAHKGGWYDQNHMYHNITIFASE